MNKKIKVLHLLSSNKYSGAENVACMIIDNMKKECEFSYCSPKGEIQNTLKTKNINYIPIEKLSYREVKKVVNRLKPDLIHAHDNRASVIASLFSKKCKIISHIHGNNRIMNKINLKSLLFNLCTRRISHIIWVSSSSFNGYVFHKKILKKSTIIYNVIDSKKVIENSKLYNVEQKYDVIFLGRLGYPKNIQRLMKIIKDLTKYCENIKVAIVGDGPDRLFVESFIKNNNLNNNIKIYGFQSNPYPILKNSKIMIMTSIYEGTPMCALEAQSLSKPIIATPVDGLKVIVKNDYNGFLSNDNIEIEKRIIELINNKKLYELYEKNTKDFFKKNNNIKKYCMNIYEIYKGV